MYIYKKHLSILVIILLILTLSLPVIAENDLDNAEEQQNSVFLVQLIGGSVIAVIIIIILIVNRNLIFKSPSRISSESVIIDEDKIIDKIRLTDSDFNREYFRDYAGKILLKVLDGISKRNSSLLRPYESNYLFTAHDKQIREYIESKRINHLDDINLVSVAIADFKGNDETETITVRATVSMLDYTTDDVSGGVLDGSRIARRNRSYRLDFIRLQGIKSTDNIGPYTICPVCSKPLTVTMTGKCSECKALLCDGSRGWILNSLVKWGHET
ncbi:MAG: TIM44-like domain-containing protein [Eubacteriales bacterium]